MPLASRQGLRFKRDRIILPIGQGFNPYTNYFEIDMDVTPYKTGPQFLISVLNGSTRRMYICIMGGGRWDIGIQNSLYNSPTGVVPIVPYKRTRVKLIMDRGTASVYADGQLSVTKPYTSYTFVSNITVGLLDGDDQGREFEGEIHSFSITYGDKTYKYFLNEGEGNIAYDSSGNGAHGTIVGASWIQKRAVRSLSAPMKPKKNLLPPFQYWNDLNPGKWTLIDGYTLVSQSLVTKGLVDYYAPVEGGKQYVFSGYSSNSSGVDGVRLILYEYDQALNQTVGGKVLTDNSPLTITTNSATRFVRVLAYGYGDNSGTIVSQPMLRLANTDDSWEPYELVPDVKAVPMKPKKNLVSDDMWEQGILSSTGAEQSLDTGIRTKFIPVKPGRTYTGKYNERFDYFLDMLYWYDENKSFIGRNTSSANPKTVTLPGNAFYVRAFYRANSTITPDLASNLKYQLEEGTTATDWEPYELIPDLKPAR